MNLMVTSNQKPIIHKIENKKYPGVMWSSNSLLINYRFLELYNLSLPASLHHISCTLIHCHPFLP